MTGTAIQVDELHVTYTRRGRPPVEAVRGVNFTVAEGEVFGLLGPNGAGKTSILEVCEGYRTPTLGAVRVLGRDPCDRAATAQLRQQVGIVLQDIAVEPFLSVREAVVKNAGYYQRPRDVNEVLEIVGLQDKRDARVRTLSGGQQRRLDLALGIVGRPSLLFLDEPTTGFDPSARRGAWEVVRSLRDEGTTIVLTTHYLDEAEALADRVCVVSAGKVLAQGPPGELTSRADAPVRIRFRLSPGATLPELPATQQTPEGDWTLLLSTDAVATLHALTGWALAEQVPLDGLVVERASLEDVYLELTAPPA